MQHARTYYSMCTFYAFEVAARTIVTLNYCVQVDGKPWISAYTIYKIYARMQTIQTPRTINTFSVRNQTQFNPGKWLWHYFMCHQNRLKVQYTSVFVSFLFALKSQLHLKCLNVSVNCLSIPAPQFDWLWDLSCKLILTP